MSTSARPTPAESWWVPLWRFAVHAWVASGIFFIVAIPAVLLELLVRWLTHHNVSPLIVAGLQLAEYTIFGVDLLLLITYVVRTGWRAGKQL